MALPLETLQHKASLVTQLRTLQQNHEALLSAFERRLEADMAAAGAGARAPLVSAGSKRPPPAALLAGPEAKRQRLLYDREVRAKAIWDDVGRILDRMRKNSKAGPFLHPVDPIALKIPDYFKIITKPMDLGTIKKKYSSKAYTSPYEVVEDVRQMFTNCRTYNPPTTQVAKQGEALAEVWDRAWAQFDIDNKWALEMKRREREDQMLAGELGDAADDDMPVRMRAMREQLGSYIAAADHVAGLAPGSHGPLEPQRAMTFEEKRKLSAHLSLLPADKLPRVVEILQEVQMMDTDSDQEVELDIDQLSDAALWALREYCNAATQPAAPPPKKTPGQRAPPDKRAPSKHAPGGGAGPGGMHPPAARPAPPAAPAAAADAGTPASPEHSEGNSAGAIVESSGRGVEHTRGIIGMGDGTVAQSGTNKMTSSAFIKSQRKAADVPREVDMSAWANVGAAAAEEGAAGAAAAEAKPAENGEGDAVWADFAQKAAEVEQQKEQQKKQAAEEAAKREEEAARRKLEEEEQQRELELLERQKEESEAADRAAAALREQQALEDMQDKAKGAAPGSIPTAAAPADAPADVSAAASPAAEALALADFAASPGTAAPADAEAAGAEGEGQGVPGGNGLGAAGDNGDDADDDGGGFEEEI